MPVFAPRVVEPKGRAAGVRIFSDARTAVGGKAAGALFSRQGAEFTALPTGASDEAVAGSLLETTAISGLEMFATVDGVATLGEQIRGN